MMEKNNNIRWYRYALVVPVVATLFLVFSCQPDTEELEKQAIAETYEEVQAQFKAVDKQMYNIKMKYLEEWVKGRNIQDVRRQIEEEGLSPNEMEMRKFKELASSSDYNKYQSLQERKNELRNKMISLPDANGIFTVVENQPAPVGGMRTFYEYVGQNMKYPAQARRMGIEGKVFVQFVVNEYGELTNFQSLKGIGAGCDDEAIRVLEGAPAWNPGTTDGKPVKVRMVMPITFKLDDGVDTSDKSVSVAEKDESTKKLDEMVVVGYEAKN